MKNILVNATHKEEVRVAILQGTELQDLNIESSHRKQLKGNIYKATAARVERGLNAVFVDYGEAKHGFLPFKAIARDFGKNLGSPSETEDSSRGFVKEGQELLVQLNRGEIGNKGALLSTYIRIPGRFLVLMPNCSWSGVRITKHAKEKHRAHMQDIFSNIKHEPGEGVILRTASIGRSEEELMWDLNNLRNLWQEIVNLAKTERTPSLIYREGNVVIHTLRDHMGPNVEKVIFDNPRVYEEAKRYMETSMPTQIDKIMMHDGDSPLFSTYKIEAKIGTAFERVIDLPQGGKVVFDQTEALLSIDVNSAKSIRGADIGATALNTNVEAVKEIALQLRLRDAGGLIVIDFIDMVSDKDRETVEDDMHRAMKYDRAQNQIGNISSFGLLEMSRQRLRTSLSESSHLICQHCNGSGWIRTIESNTLEVFRSIVREAMKEHIVSVVAKLPVETIAYFLNEKRLEVNSLESQHNISLFMIPDPSLKNPNFEIRGFRANQSPEAFKTSHAVRSNDPAQLNYTQPSVLEAKQPGVTPGEASAHQGKQSGGLFGGWFGKLFSSSPKSVKGQKIFPEDRAEDHGEALVGRRTGKAMYKERGRQISDSAGRPIRARSRTSYGKQNAGFSSRYDSDLEIDSPLEAEKARSRRSSSGQDDLYANQSTGSRRQFAAERYPGVKRKGNRRTGRPYEENLFPDEETSQSRGTQPQRRAMQARQEPMRTDGQYEPVRRQHEPVRTDRQYGSARRQREPVRRQREPMRAGRQYEPAQRRQEPIRADLQNESAQRQRDRDSSERVSQQNPVRTETSHEPVGMEWQRSSSVGKRQQPTRQRRRYDASSEQFEPTRQGNMSRPTSRESGNTLAPASSFRNTGQQQTDAPRGSFAPAGRVGAMAGAAKLHAANLAAPRQASPAELHVANLEAARTTGPVTEKYARVRSTFAPAASPATPPAELHVANLEAARTTGPVTEKYARVRSTFEPAASPAEPHAANLETARTTQPVTEKYAQTRSTFAPAVSPAEPPAEPHVANLEAVRTTDHVTERDTQTPSAFAPAVSPAEPPAEPPAELHVANLETARTTDPVTERDTRTRSAFARTGKQYTQIETDVDK